MFPDGHWPGTGEMRTIKDKANGRCLSHNSLAATDSSSLAATAISSSY